MCEGISLKHKSLLLKSKKKLRFSDSEKRIDQPYGLFSGYFLESLILAQDERWRRA